ncbi:MAG: hypothetical protein D6760_03930 [Deltaproteobacteria bacterium]|nr:MAG: hypothetical protein D6760_03930 [Deltaproteobacteria bacterium]
MADTEKSAEEQLHDAVWTWVQRLVIALVLLGAGLFAGYYQWGDAVELRKQNKQLEDRIVDLKNDRETLSTQIARERRDKEVCQKQLRELKKTCN